MSRNQIIDQAILELKGQVRVGDIVAIESDEVAYLLVNISGDIGECYDHTRNVTKFYPVSELFDCNLVKARCIQVVQTEIRELFNPNQNN